MRDGNRQSRLSTIIPKFHFCSQELFREEPLVKWHHTGSVLFTAYDFYSTDSFWIESVIKSGRTLKEALIELGLPKETTLLADTGVFEAEAKKAKISQELGISVSIDLSVRDVLFAYSASGADKYISPDEIIMPEDPVGTIKEKANTIKENLNALLGVVPTSKVVGVIQGHEASVINEIVDFYRENQIRTYAAGGLIPLWHADPSLLPAVLRYMRKATKGRWIHAFGLPSMKLLPLYLSDIGVNSVDTSALLYLTGRRLYMVGLEAKPVRIADFAKCSCEGCRGITPDDDTDSAQFFTCLNIHNVLEVSRISEELAKKRGQVSHVVTGLSQAKPGKVPAPKQHVSPRPPPRSSWKTAQEAMSPSSEPDLEDGDQ